MSNKNENPKLTPISKNELGQIEGGFTELPASNLGTPIPINFSCPSQVSNSGCPTPPPPRTAAE